MSKISATCYQISIKNFWKCNIRPGNSGSKCDNPIKRLQLSERRRSDVKFLDDQSQFTETSNITDEIKPFCITWLVFSKTLKQSAFTPPQNSVPAHTLFLQLSATITAYLQKLRRLRQKKGSCCLWLRLTKDLPFKIKGLSKCCRLVTSPESVDVNYFWQAH